MIVDSHAHSFPGVQGRLNGKDTRSLSYGKVKVGGIDQQWFPPSFSESNSPLDLLIEYMDWVGVSKAVITQGPMYGFHNGYIVNEQRKYPDRIKSLGILEQYHGPQCLNELTRLAREDGFCGIKLELETIISNDSQFTLDSHDMLDIYDLCQAEGLRIMIHPVRGTGTEAGISRIINMFPNLQIIIAHLGLAPCSGWKEKVDLARRDNVAIDTSGLPALFLQDKYPYLEAQNCMRWAADRVGCEKMLWGSDYPALLKWCTYSQTVDIVRESKLFLDSEKDKILGTNAERVFGF